VASFYPNLLSSFAERNKRRKSEEAETEPSRGNQNTEEDVMTRGKKSKDCGKITGNSNTKLTGNSENIRNQGKEKQKVDRRQGKYICPFTDFGFKKIFGTEPNKDLLIDFLNQLLAEREGTIVDLQYIPTEQLGRNYDDRRAIFDIYCKNEAGERFIVELQKSSQTYFKDRSIYYSTFPIQAQAPKGNWDYQLKAVYTIAILDFTFKDTKEDRDIFHHKVKLHDTDTKEVFYDKLSYVYLELPKFTKPLEECDTHFEKWLYVLRNLEDLTKRPAKLKEKIFKKLFKVAEIANYDEVEYADYQSSLRNYRDTSNQLNTKFEEGIKIGEQRGRKERDFEIARELLDVLDNETIAVKTGLTVEEIEALRDLKP
jgi:predicted transposase/invertase (TIGR01784 family)